MSEGQPAGMRDATLCFLLRGASPTTVLPDEVLLGHKKRGFGVDKWAGIGGRIEEGESVVAAACREVMEEIGVTISEADMLPRGLIKFRFPYKPSWNQDVYLFVATAWCGEPTESEEMRPAWFTPEALPYEQMWDDGRYWLPRLLVGEMLYLTISYGEDNLLVSEVIET